MEESNIKYMTKEDIRNIDPSQIVSIRMTSGSVLILKQGNNQEENNLKKENQLESNARIPTGNNSSIYVQEGVGKPCKHCGKSYRIFEVNKQDYAIDSQKKKNVEIEEQCPHEEKKEEKEVLRGVDGKPLLNDILTGEELVSQENNKDEQKSAEKEVNNNFDQQEQEMNQNEINKTGEEQYGQEAKEEIDQNDYQEQEQEKEQFQPEEENNDKNYNDNQKQKEEQNQNDYQEQEQFQQEEENNDKNCNDNQKQKEEQNQNDFQEQEQFQHQEEYNEQEQQPENPPEEINNENKNEELANDENLNDNEQNQQDYHDKEIEQDIKYQQNENEKNSENEKEKEEINPPKLNDENNQQNLEAEYQQPENQIQEDNEKEKNLEIQPPEQQGQQKNESIENQEQQPNVPVPIEPTIPQILNQNKNPVLVQPLDPQIPPIKNPVPEPQAQVNKAYVPVQPIKPQIQKSIEPTFSQVNKQKINILPKQFPGKKYIRRGLSPSRNNYIHSYNYDMGNKSAYNIGYFRPAQKKLVSYKRMFIPIGTIENMTLTQGAKYPKTYIPSRRIGLQSAYSGTAKREVSNFNNQKRVLCPECAALEYDNSYQYNYTEYSNDDKALNIDEDKNKYYSQTYQAKTKDFIQNYKFHEIVDTSDKTKTHVVVKKGGVIVSSDK